MGCLQNNSGTPDNTRLSRELAKQKQKDEYIHKLLFLGSGGSGKSTIFKQLKTIHGEGWTKEERMAFTQHIYDQIIEQMKIAIECVEILAEEELEKEYGENYKRPVDFNPYSKLSNAAQDAVIALQSVLHPKWDDTVALGCKLLWNEAIIKHIYENRAIMKIEDSSAYFWDRIDHIMSDGFVPNEEDILLVRRRTTGVTDQQFTIENNTFHVMDVGGQRSERKKWIHCFEDVTAVIFVVSLSCYDEVMFEDEGDNSMVDTLELFGSICNNEWFKKTPMILFLNKTDLFKEKLADNKPITLCSEFKDYNGNGSSFEDTTTYIKSVFGKKDQTPNDKSIFMHLTCATDKNNVQNVFNDVQHIIIEQSLVAQDLLE